MKKNFFFLLYVMADCLLLSAQSGRHPSARLVSPKLDYIVKVENASIQEVGGKVVVSLKLNAFQDVPARQSVVLVPELVDTFRNRSVAFPAIFINSRNQQIFFERELKKHFPDALAVRKQKGDPLPISYLRYAEYEDWMLNSVLRLQKMSCGCNVYSNRGTSYLCPFVNEEPVVALHPVFKIPLPEQVKTRQEKGTALLHFRTAKTDIDPTYMGNEQELQKINNTIHFVKSDPNVKIQHLSIVGYASPEGEQGRNMRLSIDRTAALRKYIDARGLMAAKHIDIASQGENWKGFMEYLNNHPEIPEHTELLAIANQNIDQDAKERLMRKKAAKGFLYCLRNCFPSLRSTEYTVTYVVRPFTVEESEQIFETRPINLSLNEIYRLAEKYAQQPEKYNAIMRKAYLLFPKDEYINLTMAYLAIQQQRPDEAEEYLKKVSDCPEKTLNLGLVHFLHGEIEEAIRLTEEAQKQGVKEAAEQLEELKKIK